MKFERHYPLTIKYYYQIILPTLAEHKEKRRDPRKEWCYTSCGKKWSAGPAEFCLNFPDQIMYTFESDKDFLMFRLAWETQ